MTAPASPSQQSPFAPPRAPEARCANCDATLAGRFCSQCGQEARSPDPTARELAREWWEEFTSVDGRLLRTLRVLLQPGRLTTEYLAGRRARYVAPLKLYLWLSVLYFFASAATDDEPRRSRLTVSGQTPADSVAAQAALDSAARAIRADTTRSLSGRTLGAALKRAAAHEDAFEASVTAWIPRAVFAMVPAFALLLGLVYRSRRQRYPRHLAFALHLHAFVFALLLVSQLLALLRLGRGAEAAGAVLFVVGVPVYGVLAMRRVYGGRLWTTVARGALLLALYLPLSLIAMLFVMGAALLTF